MGRFKLKSEYVPTGDQPQAIERLAEGLEKGYKYQTLRGYRLGQDLQHGADY